MAVEYDLVVIGDTSAGRLAAAIAAAWGARVALCTRDGMDYTRQLIQGRTQTEIARCVRQKVGVPEPLARTEAVLSAVEQGQSLAALAAAGVDAIATQGQFEPRSLSFETARGSLQSRSYLLALSTRPLLPEVLQDYRERVFTLADLAREGVQILPHRVLVVGGSWLSFEWAQNLARLGRDVSLAVSSRELLPFEDEEVSRYIKAILEADGVKVYTQSALNQVREIERCLWVQVGDRAWETDGILAAVGEEVNLEGLNLAAAGVKFDAGGIKVNSHLQTTNRRIYACCGAIDGYIFENVARYEAQIAVRNALFFPRWRVDYEAVARSGGCDPLVARVGLTQEQARKRYGNSIQVIRQYFKSNPKSLILGEMTGFCKLVVARNGEILGAHLVGKEAEEVVSAIAWARQHKIKLGTLARLYPAFPSACEILSESARIWEQQRQRSGGWWRERFFDLCRSWVK